MGEKKCTHCGKWSRWNKDVHDVCEHCNQPLGGRDLEYKKQREQDSKANKEQWIFYIKESDPDVVRGMKKIGNFVYTILIAIISFLAWVIAALPG